MILLIQHLNQEILRKSYLLQCIKSLHPDSVYTFPNQYPEAVHLSGYNPYQEHLRLFPQILNIL